MRPLAPHQKKRFRHWKILIVPLFIVIAAGIWLYAQLMWPVTVPDQIVIKPGDTMAVLTSDRGFFDRMAFKNALQKHSFDANQLEVGTYTFPEKTMSAMDVLDVFAAWPGTAYANITILEWWSSYDIDDALSRQGLINAWDYLDAVADVDAWRSQFAFLSIVPQGRETLEGYLYPDTYFIDTQKDVLDQLITLQLRAFEDKVYNNVLLLRDLAIKLELTHDAMPFSMDDVIILASVIEKEEKTDANKPMIAGLFFNRLAQGMRLGADITLCYGLQRPYEECTVPVIIQHLNDTSNLYNTRALAGMPPTPIANPEALTVEAVMWYEHSEYLFYLHAPDGQIYYGETNADHERNKALYL